MTQLCEMVVTKGRTVVHDGKTYEQHSRVRLPEREAERLEAVGFVVSLATVRQALQDPADDETHDDGGGGTAGGAGGHNSDDASGDTAGDTDPDDAAPTGSNKPGNAKKGAK